jgi:hypothetical protein
LTVLLKFGFFVGLHRWIENHEFPAVVFNEESQNIDPKTGESVTMGNHNLELISAQELFQ